uniref:Immunoglobulin domain-containing protein n=1 Tax=Poecilia formosa TaxID=48698 RepID=A0A087XYU0_POEFO
SESLLFVFAAQLQNGEVESVQGRTYTEMEGKNITVSCSFTFTGRRMYFCKTDCSRDNILIETTDYRAQSGRYIIEFNRTGFATHVVYVSIMELKTSDSGRYRCALGRTGIRHNDFKIFVISGLDDGETMETFNRNEGENITVRCEFGYTGTKRFFCKGTCEGRNILVETTEDTDQRGRFSITYEERDIFSTDFLHVSITDLKPSDSGWYQCRSDETWTGTLYYDFYLVVTEESKSFSPSPSETIKLSEKPAAASGSS